MTSGSAASDAAPTTVAQKATGRRRRNPPILKMSCSPPSASITTPADRNSRALKKAWVMKWNTAALQPATPSARNM